MDSSAPVVSVITIVKNNEILLPRAIDSVLGQTLPYLEHIIVNDGSTDRTANIIDSYAAKDTRVKPKHLVQNIGRAMARNTGLDSVRGKYIFFLDSDDYLPTTALHDLYTAAEKDRADIVFGRIRPFDQKTGEWLPRHYTDALIEPERHVFCLEDNNALVNDHSIIGRFYRTEMQRRYNIIFNTRRKNGEDLLFSFYFIFYAQRMTTLPDKITYFYSIGNYLDKANESKICDARDNVIETIEFVLKHGNNNLRRCMLKKGACFASSLYRAQKVYGKDEEKFKKYLASLLPLVQGVTDDILQTCSGYVQQFVRALKDSNYDRAHLLWCQEEMKQDINKLHAENQRLAHQLDALYNSTSWLVTAPFRRVVSIFSRK